MNLNHSILSWESRRARLSHDQLKNELVPMVSRLTRVIEGRVDAPGCLDEFVSSGCVRINNFCAEIEDLLSAVENEASPKVFFKLEPLNACPPEIMEWLPDLLHDDWIQSKDIPKRLATVRLAVSDVLRALEVLRTALSAGRVSDALCEADSLRHALSHLSSVLGTLSDLVPYRR